MRKLLSACFIVCGAAGIGSSADAGVIGSDPVTVTVVSHITRGGDRSYSATYQLDPSGNGSASLISGDIPGFMLATIHQTFPNATGTGDVTTFCLKPTSMAAMHQSILSGARSLDLLVSGFSDNETDTATGAVFAPANIGFAEFNGNFGMGRRSHSVRMDAPSRNFQFSNSAPDPITGDFAMDFRLSLPRGAGMLACAEHLDFSMATSQEGPLISSGQVKPPPETVPEPLSLLVWCGMVPGGWLIRRSRQARRDGSSR